MQGSLRKTVCALWMVSLSGMAYADSTAKALNCYQFDQCAYFSPFYQQNKDFQGAITAAFTDKKMTVPAWVENGTSVPLVPVLLQGKRFLIGTVLEPHNATHQMSVFYLPEAKEVAIRYIQPSGDIVWLGNNAVKWKLVLEAYTNPRTPLSQIVNSDYATLPVILDPYL